MILKSRARVTVAVLAAMAGVTLFAPGASAASEANIRIGGIDSIQWGAGHGLNTAKGGTTAGRTAVNEVTIRRHIDATSAKLRQANASGKRFSKILLDMRERNGRTAKITLDDAIISSLQMGDSGGPNGTMEETIMISFDRVSTAGKTDAMEGMGSMQKQRK